MALKTTKGTMTSGKVNYQGQVLPIQKIYTMKNGIKCLVFSGDTWHWSIGEEIWKFEGYTDPINGIAVDTKGYIYIFGKF